ncbi:MAG: D-2-hydroxyacid dehydrogenase family protein [Actinophytocola sp.]|uniref:D-2-hydroxyacid dehydrogenase family protein n=1 Tax=Actinophytocola sp. TaxID=1872138 RepID=UPI001328C26C|nr:D-2-hydroxyacid dehydrogenase family protein [Actinophytocola sp.]MPZ82452.1 D-2-hydroxyacid dehydrogenase family protein [Actinophytocola sp.]
MRVAVLDDYQHVALSYSYWSELPADIVVEPIHEHVADVGELAARLAPYDVVVATRERTALPRELLERLPNLRLIVTAGMANASIDTAAAAERGVTVCGTASVGTSTVELTWALVLAVLRGIPSAEATLRRGEWQAGSLPGGDLAGATLGVLGLGRIGARVAAVGQAFGMRVVAWSQNLTAERAAEVGVDLASSKEELLASADVVTLHLRLSNRTRGLLGAPELALMKPTAYLVNTSRGPLIDERALIDAMTHGRLAGLGLDVYGSEPLPAGHPLIDLPNTVLTPHLGYVSRRTFDVFFRDMVADIAAFHAGAPVRVIS